MSGLLLSSQRCPGAVAVRYCSDHGTVWVGAAVAAVELIRPLIRAVPRGPLGLAATPEDRLTAGRLRAGEPWFEKA